MPSAPAMASSSLDLERLMADLIPKLTPTKRRELRYLVRGLKTRKVIGGIPSVSAALVARAPALVGAHLWRSCVEKQRREPEPRLAPRRPFLRRARRLPAAQKCETPQLRCPAMGTSVLVRLFCTRAIAPRGVLL